MTSDRPSAPAGAPVNVPDERLAELVRAAQDAETRWLEKNRRRTGNWRRVTDTQAARYIAAVLDRHEAMVRANERQKIADEMRREARRRTPRGRAHTYAQEENILGLADMIARGDSDDR